jgi:heat shock protein HtpX
MSRRRPQVDLPAELGLTLRMLLAGGLGLLIVLALLALLAAASAAAIGEDDGWAVPLVAVAIVAGVAAHALRGPRVPEARTRGRAPETTDRERVRAALERLAVLADLPAPRVEVVRHPLPIALTSGLRRRSATVHVTTGLLDRLGDRELQAVCAHELGHVLHRDGAVMAVLAAPPSAVWAFARSMWDDDPVRSLFVFPVFAPVVAPPFLVLALLSRIVARHRELAADRAATLLTGSAASVAAAIAALDEGLRAARRRDRRAARRVDAFAFLPAEPATGVRRVWATHPPVERRLERLERFERALQTA